MKKKKGKSIQSLITEFKNFKKLPSSPESITTRNKNDSVIKTKKRIIKNSFKKNGRQKRTVNFVENDQDLKEINDKEEKNPFIFKQYKEVIPEITFKLNDEFPISFKINEESGEIEFKLNYKKEYKIKPKCTLHKLVSQKNVLNEDFLKIKLKNIKSPDDDVSINKQISEIGNILQISYNDLFANDEHFIFKNLKESNKLLYTDLNNKLMIQFKFNNNYFLIYVTDELFNGINIALNGKILKNVKFLYTVTELNYKIFNDEIYIFVTCLNEIFTIIIDKELKFNKGNEIFTESLIKTVKVNNSEYYIELLILSDEFNVYNFDNKMLEKLNITNEEELELFKLKNFSLTFITEMDHILISNSKEIYMYNQKLKDLNLIYKLNIESPEVNEDLILDDTEINSENDEPIETEENRDLIITNIISEDKFTFMISIYDTKKKKSCIKIFDIRNNGIELFHLNLDVNEFKVDDIIIHKQLKIKHVYLYSKEKKLIYYLFYIHELENTNYSKYTLEFNFKILFTFKNTIFMTSKEKSLYKTDFLKLNSISILFEEDEFLIYQMSNLGDLFYQVYHITQVNTFKKSNLLRNPMLKLSSNLNTNCLFDYIHHDSNEDYFYDNVNYKESEKHYSYFIANATDLISKLEIGESTCNEIDTIKGLSPISIYIIKYIKEFRFGRSLHDILNHIESTFDFTLKIKLLKEFLNKQLKLVDKKKFNVSKWIDRYSEYYRITEKVEVTVDDNIFVKKNTENKFLII